MIFTFRRKLTAAAGAVAFGAAAVLVAAAPSTAATAATASTATRASGAPNAVALSGIVMLAVPPGHDYYRTNSVSGEAGTVQGTWSVNETASGTSWTLVKDAKWNPPGAYAQVRFRSISHSGYVLPSRTMGQGATHCWYPSPTWDGYPSSGCGTYGEAHATAFDGSNFTTTYKVTVQAYGGGTSCYVVTPFAETIVGGSACPGAP